MRPIADEPVPVSTFVAVHMQGTHAMKFCANGSYSNVPLGRSVLYMKISESFINFALCCFTIICNMIFIEPCYHFFIAP